MNSIFMLKETLLFAITLGKDFETFLIVKIFSDIYRKNLSSSNLYISKLPSSFFLSMVINFASSIEMGNAIL